MVLYENNNDKVFFNYMHGVQLYGLSDVIVVYHKQCFRMFLLNIWKFEFVILRDTDNSIVLVLMVN